MTITITISSDVTDVWPSDVITNSNPRVLKIEKWKINQKEKEKEMKNKIKIKSIVFVLDNHRLHLVAFFYANVNLVYKKISYFSYTFIYYTISIT